MRHILVFGGLLALVAGGCASSQSIQQRAAEHQAQADRYASARQYDAAAREQRKADELSRKAAERLYDESTVTPPIAPPAEPAIPPPLDPTMP
jgi:hypothetical protein